MADFANKYPADTYKGILNISNDNTGLTSTKKTIQTAEGTDSKLQLSTTAVNIVSGFEIGSVAVNASAVELNYVQNVTSAIQTQIDTKVDTSGTPVNNDFARFTDADTVAGRSYSEVRVDLGLVIGTNIQASDAGLLSLAGLTWVSDSFIKVTATDTYAIRTISETKTDLALNNVSNVAIDDTAYNATSWDANSDGATKNAIRNKVVSIDSAIGLNTTHRGLTNDPHSVTASQVGLGSVTNVATSDVAYDATSWNTNTDAATKNVVRDKVETMDTSISSNTTHRSSDGTNHTFIDQDLRTTFSPTFSGMALGAGNLTLTGSIAVTGARVTKGWFTDLEVTNAIAGSITGNAATVTTITGLAPDTATTQSSQPNITSLATLTSLTVDNVIINGTNIGHTSDIDLMALASGALTINGTGTFTGNLKSNSNFVMEGNTSRNVDRAFYLQATGTASSTTCSFKTLSGVDGFNHTDLGIETVTEGTPGARFSLNAAGTVVAITGISETVIGLKSFSIRYNTTGNAFNIACVVTAGDLVFELFDDSGNVIVFSDIVNTKTIQMMIHYVTST